MKKILIKIIILFSIVFILGSCNDPIFYIVHEEIPILPPFINGSPTNFVVFNNKLYVASGKSIYEYNGKKWEGKEKGNFVGCLAATSTNLYAQYLDNNNGKIISYDTSGNSTDVAMPGNANVQSIYASGDVLFVCVRNDNINNSTYTYEIYFRKEGRPGFTKFPDTSNSMSISVLNGVASDSTYYYLCIYEGIFCVEKTKIDTLTDLDDLLILGRFLEFTGIIELKNDYVAAINIDGLLYEITNATITNIITTKFSDDRHSSGALALWYNVKDDTMPSLLLVGRKETYYSSSSNYTNGYIEITLNTTTGRISGSSFKDPGTGSPTSIDSYDAYVSSLGKNAINHMIQAPYIIDSNMTLFASTHQKGVWSYRFRNDKWQWNSEQEEN